MTTIAEFKVARNNSSYRASTISSAPGAIKEQMGPEGYEKYCNLTSQNRISVTIPHIDKFEKCNDYSNIVLIGRTEKYTIPIYGGNFEYSVKQYFLEHPTRNGIQYLFWDNEQNDSTIVLIAMIPGLVYDTNDGTVLGYLHNYVATNPEDGGGIILELPYTDEDGYSISGAPFIQDSNKIEFYGITSETEVTITKGANYASFKLFPYNSSSGEGIYKIKNVNEFADYIIASQMTDGKITSVLNALTETKTINSNSSGIVYYPKYFMTLGLYTSSESVKNITPNIYKVPAALVPKDGERIFMKDVTGISGNIFSN